MVDNLFQPEDIDYPGGTITLVNSGAALHNLSVEGHGDIDVDVPAGSTRTVPALSLAPGTYKVFCKYHKALGMTATLTVT